MARKTRRDNRKGAKRGAKEPAGVTPRGPSVKAHVGERSIAKPALGSVGREPLGQDVDQYQERRPDIDPSNDKLTYGDAVEGAEGEYEAEMPEDWHYSQIVQSSEDISEFLTEPQIADLSLTVLREYKLDESSREDVVRAYDKAMDAARNVRKAKDYPFTNAANVRYPLINTASLQFAARAYPAIVNGPDIVKVGINGADQDGAKKMRAKRVAEHMSYQCLQEMPEWEKQMDELLHHLPLAGTCYRMVYYDTELNRPATEFVTLKDFVVNNDAKVLRDTPRYTRIREFYPYQIQEKIKSGFYRDVSDVLVDSDEDGQKPRIVLEQHRRHDLDGDGCDEPYIVTIDKETQAVLRVVPSADLDTLMVDFDEEEGRPYVSKSEHEQMYIRYVFMPDPEGKMHGMGFGLLLESISDAINTIFNQILDAAHLQNAGGGFLGGGVDFGKRREQRRRPGTWRQLKASGVDIRQAIVPHNWPGPSPVLYDVLGLLIEAGKEVGSIKDVLSGDAGSANMPVGTTMALIEQGLQAFTAIYKRIYRSLSEEYKLLYRLNALYLPDEVYFSFMDDQQAVARADYAMSDMNVTPVADPTAVTTMQKMAKAEFGLQFKGQPHIDSAAIDKRAMEAAGIDEPDALFAKPDPQAQEMQLRQAMLEMEKLEAEVAKLQAETVRNVADAQSKETKTEIEEAEAVLRAVSSGRDLMGQDAPQVVQTAKGVA